MAHNDQDFHLHAGDESPLAFTVTDEATGAAVDLSAVTEITWALAADAESAALVTKTKTGGDITVTDAVNGKFEVALDSADTDGLNGRYWHEAVIVDGAGKRFTVATGEARVYPTVVS